MGPLGATTVLSVIIRTMVAVLVIIFFAECVKTQGPRYSAKPYIYIYIYLYPTLMCLLLGNPQLLGVGP